MNVQRNSGINNTETIFLSHSFITVNLNTMVLTIMKTLKLEKNFGSIKDMSRLPGALFIIDIKKEHIAVREAQKLGLPIFAIVDTNSNPNDVDYAIPGNDDASKSINVILDYILNGVKVGLNERKVEKEEKAAAKAKQDEAKTEAPAAVEASNDAKDEAKRLIEK